MRQQKAAAVITTIQRIQSNPYIPHAPTTKQLAFLALECLEAMYGGAAGGGKSDALLMAALMFVDASNYHALLLRRTYADLALPGAIMSRAHEWLMGTDARWNDKEKTYTFPSGATLTFGYLQSENDKYRYQSSEFQFIGFDELTQFTETQYTYLFSRLRRVEGSPIPLRMRAATNPGGEGHGWVYNRFPIGRRDEGDATKRVFIPAGLSDNPFIDQAEYRAALSELDEITRKQLEFGVWVTDPQGKPFKRDWWRNRNRFHLDANAKIVARYITWDTALKDKEHNAYSAYGVIEVAADFRLRLRHAGRARLQFPDLAAAITDTAREWSHDGKLREILIEDKASGTSVLQTLRNDEFGHLLKAFAPTGDKLQRWNQAALWCQRGAVELPYPHEAAAWLSDFEQELFNVPDSQFKDYADMFAQGVIYLEYYCAGWWSAQTKEAA